MKLLDNLMTFGAERGGTPPFFIAEAREALPNAEARPDVWNRGTCKQ